MGAEMKWRVEKARVDGYRLYISIGGEEETPGKIRGNSGRQVVGVLPFLAQSWL